nr:uncharacterized protein LOC113802811 [Penaeus vannamei]
MGCDLRAKDFYGASNSDSFSSNNNLDDSDNPSDLQPGLSGVEAEGKMRLKLSLGLGSLLLEHTSCDPKLLKIGITTSISEFSNLVCRAYDYLCQSIKIPSAFFTHITCSVIKFFIEMGDRGKSFYVLKEVRRLNAKDPNIFTLLVPPDQETTKRHTAEVLELVQFVCEGKVQLSAPTFTLLINAIRAVDQLVLTIDLIICAVKVCQYDPEVSLLEILILDSIRKFPQLLWPVSNLVCVLPAKSLVHLIPTLRHVLDMLHFAPPPAQQVEDIIVRYCHSKGVMLYEESVGQFPQTGRERYTRASPNFPGSQGHQEALYKDGNVNIPSQPSRFRVGDCNKQERNGPVITESNRVSSLPSLAIRKQLNAPLPVQLQNTLQKQPTTLRLDHKIYRNTGHDYQKPSSITDAPRPSLPRSPQIQNIPGFSENNSLPPGIKINIIGWPNVETKHTMNSTGQVIQKLKCKQTDNVTVSEQPSYSQKAEGPNTITGNCSKVQSHSLEMGETGLTRELKTSKCIPRNQRISAVASSRSRLDHFRFMMPKSGKGFPPVETVAKGSENCISEPVQLTNCSAESESNKYGDFKIDLQGVPDQSLVSEDEYTEVEQGESNSMATLNKILRGLTKVENKTERRWRLTEVFKELTKGEILRKTARNFSNIVRALKEMKNLKAAEEVLGELGVSLMVECSGQRYVAEAASVVSLLLESDLLVSAYLPLQKETPPSEQALSVMALEVLHSTGHWDSFKKVLDDVYWSGGSEDVQTKLKCLSRILQCLLTSVPVDSTSHIARLQNAVKILASLVKYFRYDVQIIRNEYTKIMDLVTFFIKTWKCVNESEVPTLIMEVKALVLEAKSFGIKVPEEIEESAGFCDMERQETASLHMDEHIQKTIRLHQNASIKGEFFKGPKKTHQLLCPVNKGTLWRTCKQDVGLPGGNCKQESAIPGEGYMERRDSQGKSFFQGRTVPIAGSTSMWDLSEERGASLTVCLQGNSDANIARKVVMHGQASSGIESRNQAQAPIVSNSIMERGDSWNRQVYPSVSPNKQAHRIRMEMQNPSRFVGRAKHQSAKGLTTSHNSVESNWGSEFFSKGSKKFRKAKYKGSKRQLMRLANSDD